MEVIGDYEYNSANRLGLGAFAIVFKGRSRKVSHYKFIKLIKIIVNHLYGLKNMIFIKFRHFIVLLPI